MAMPARARGILGMALTWGVGLAGVATSLLVGGVLLDIVPASVYGIRELVAVAVRALVVGGAAGALFAMVMARKERATTLTALRRGRVATWGFLATAGIASALMLTAPVVLPVVVLVPSILLAGAAVGVLGVARRGDPLLRSGEESEQSSLPPVR